MCSQSTKENRPALSTESCWAHRDALPSLSWTAFPIPRLEEIPQEIEEEPQVPDVAEPPHELEEPEILSFIYTGEKPTLSWPLLKSVLHLLRSLPLASPNISHYCPLPLLASSSVVFLFLTPLLWFVRGLWSPKWEKKNKIGKLLESHLYHLPHSSFKHWDLGLCICTMRIMTLPHYKDFWNHV